MNSWGQVTAMLLPGDAADTSPTLSRHRSPSFALYSANPHLAPRSPVDIGRFVPAFRRSRAMPQVRKQQYTRPIPEGATRTTMTIRRRGKDVEVPAVRFKGPDGRMMSAPVVQSGKGAGTHHRVQSECFYGRVKGKPVKLLTNKSASETMLTDLVREADLGQVGRADPFAKSAKQPLEDHIAAFGRFLAGKGDTPFHVLQTTQRLTRCLIVGCEFATLRDLEASGPSDWLSSQQSHKEAIEVPDGSETFTVREAARILGTNAKALAKNVRRRRLVPIRKGAVTLVPREVLLDLASRRSRSMGEQTASHYVATLHAFGR